MVIRRFTTRKFKMNKSIDVIKNLITKKLIPEVGNFEVTEQLIDSYQSIYKKLYETKGVNIKSSNKKYARKLAGIFLMQENQKRLSIIKQVKISDSKYTDNCGIVYIISNNSFPGCYKVGMTKNLETRLKSYQTYDPYRSYKIEHYRFVKDAKYTEAEILKHFNFSIVKGEWIKDEKLKIHFIEKLENM